MRQRPADAKFRVFQLLCVVGQWERALTQLDVAADLDAEALAMKQMVDAVLCETLRRKVRRPTIAADLRRAGRVVALLIESLLVIATPRNAEATALWNAPSRRPRPRREPSTASRSSGSPMPICGWDQFEAVINGRYYWLPFERLTKIDLEAPADLPATWSGSRRISSSPTAAKALA